MKTKKVCEVNIFRSGPLKVTMKFNTRKNLAQITGVPKPRKTH